MLKINHPNTTRNNSNLIANLKTIDKRPSLSNYDSTDK